MKLWDFFPEKQNKKRKKNPQVFYKQLLGVHDHPRLVDPKLKFFI